MELQINGIFYNLSRAIEIAMVGGFKVDVCANPENYKNAKSDLNEIKSFFQPLYNFWDKSKSSLLVEIVKPTKYLLNIKCESLSDIAKRVSEAKKNNKPDLVLCESSKTLLKTAIERLDFGLTDIKNIHIIAQTIAQLENSKKIRPEHIAEAIQYTHIYDEKCVLL